ncbi:Hypothetical predicted protein [Prunus dulcis]|uniref:Uncharacterized protein n=1 Tax=Prunus dulcis TaxID=3755 RepID=A0A5E4GLQ2_PRUDU|nr:Hypothetical predicted protein [Prunus dulcis]
MDVGDNKALRAFKGACRVKFLNVLRLLNPNLTSLIKVSCQVDPLISSMGFESCISEETRRRGGSQTQRKLEMAEELTGVKRYAGKRLRRQSHKVSSRRFWNTELGKLRFGILALDK